MMDESEAVQPRIDRPDERKRALWRLLGQWSRQIIDAGAIPVALVGYRVVEGREVEYTMALNPETLNAAPTMLREVADNLDADIQASKAPPGEPT